MFVHSVYFWLRSGLTPEERARFDREVRTLTTLESVRAGWVGTPADTDRPVIDRSYTYGLVVVFDSKAGHDAYQVDPIHLRFKEICAPLWEKNLIYDFETD